MGVDLFFVISGFVIGLSAFAEIDKRGVWNFQGAFFSRRVARIVPLHYLTMFVFVVFISPELLFTNFWTNFGSHLLFVHNLNVNLHGAINGSNWSLATEMQFYVLMLLVAPWIRTGRWWAIAAVFIGTAWAWRYGVTLFVQQSSQLGPFPVFVAATQLPGMLDEFVAGLLLARLVRSELGKKLLGGGICSSRFLGAGSDRAVCDYGDLLALCEFLELSPDGDNVAFPLGAVFCIGSAIRDLN